MISLDVKTRGAQTPWDCIGNRRLECRRGKRNSSVAVKCVDIRRNTSGEGGLLDDD